jgi:hypothetical protein
MRRSIFRFYEELNSFLSVDRRKRDFEVEFEGQKTVEELIEGVGVPCEKVDLILADGQSVGLHHVPRQGEYVSIYPVFEALNISEVTCLPGRPLRTIKFILDVDLTQLALYMQASGYDAYFDALASRSEIIAISRKENRIILTMDNQFLGSEEITHVILLPKGAPQDQLKKIVKQLDIQPSNDLHVRR